MSNKIYTLTVPVTYQKDGKDQTSFRRVGAVGIAKLLMRREAFIAYS